MRHGQRVHPAPGERMPVFTLASADGHRVDISRYCGRLNLVLIFTGGAECRHCRHAVLTDLCHEPREYARAGARLLVVLQCSPLEAALVQHRDNLLCPVLVDEDGQVHRAVGASAPDGLPTTTVFVVDRQGKVCLANRTWQGQPLPFRQTLLEQLQRLADSSSPEEPTGEETGE